MKRLTLSIILGLVFPFVCFIAIGVSTDYMTPSFLTEVEISGQSAPGILLAPFSLPFYVAIILNKNKIVPHIFDTFLFRFLFFILFNWILYGFIIYLILGKLRKRKIRQSSKTPPPPPKFYKAG